MNIRELVGTLRGDCFWALNFHHQNQFNMIDEDYSNLLDDLKNTDIKYGVYARVFDLEEENSDELKLYNLEPRVYIYIGQGHEKEILSNSRTSKFLYKLRNKNKKNKSMDIKVFNTINNILDYYKSKDDEFDEREFLIKNMHIVMHRLSEFNARVCELELQNRIVDTYKDLILINTYGCFANEFEKPKKQKYFTMNINGKKYKFIKTVKK